MIFIMFIKLSNQDLKNLHGGVCLGDEGVIVNDDQKIPAGNGLDAFISAFASGHGSGEICLGPEVKGG